MAGGITRPPDIDDEVFFVGLVQRIPLVRLYIEHDQVAVIHIYCLQVPGKCLIINTHEPIRLPSQPVEQDGVGFQRPNSVGLDHGFDSDLQAGCNHYSTENTKIMFNDVMLQLFLDPLF